MRVLLVEPAYRARYAPLGLLKISTMLKAQGHKVKYEKGRTWQLGRFKPDEIWITTLFTYYHEMTIKTILFYKDQHPKAKIRVGGIFASLMPDFIERHTGIRPHFGLIPEAESCAPDYSLVESDTSIAFTSRGCVRKCPFCIVPKVEGKLVPIEGWERGVDVTKPMLSLWDNNWLAKPHGDIEKDIGILRGMVERGVREIDFNQGLDARLFFKSVAEFMKGLPMRPLRFSFDSMAVDGHFQRAMRLAQRYGLSSKQRWRGDGNPRTAMIYQIYNYKDTPQEFYYRLRETVKAGACGYPMQFSPHDDLERDYVGRHWTMLQRNNVRCIGTRAGGGKGQISSTCREEFEFYWGKNEKEFMEIVSQEDMRKVVAYKVEHCKAENVRRARKAAKRKK